MFANFKATPLNLGTTKATVRHNRSKKGCYTCRQGRKKCDEAKPVCGRCSRRPVVNCVWEEESAQQSRSSRRSSTEVASTIPRSPKLNLESYLGHAGGDAEQGQLELLLTMFNNVHSLSYTDPKISLLSLGISHAVQRPGLMHAYAACGAAILSGSDPKWVQVGLAHHVLATNLVSSALEEINGQAVAVENEWLLAAINTLHIFETLRKDDARPSTLHLAGARQLHDPKRSNSMPRTPFGRLILGEFVFQLAISSTFDPSCFHGDQSYYDVHYLLKMMRGINGDGNHELANWETSSPMGMAHVMFDYIFRLSYLRMHVPLSGWKLIEAGVIMAKLRSWEPFLSASSPNPLASYTSPFYKEEYIVPPEMIQMAELYRAAALVFVQKLLDPTLNSENAVICTHVQHGVHILDNIRDAKLKDATILIWPILILGIAAITPQEMKSYRRPLSHLLVVCGVGCVRAVMILLENAWEPRQELNGGTLGLDVLFKDELLSQVIF